MRSLSVKVGIMPGSHVLNTCREMVELATRLGVMVEGDFNNVLIVAKPGADPEKLAEAWGHEMSADRQVRIACVHPEAP